MHHPNPLHLLGPTPTLSNLPWTLSIPFPPALDEQPKKEAQKLKP
jgi:hypothetical protein